VSKQIGTEETALATRNEFSSELAPTSAQAEKQFEIQSAIIIANKFRRDEDAAFLALMKACKRLSFAEQSSYSFPRGGQQVTGPSVHMARGAARVWKNLQYGLRITRDDDDSRQIQAFAWDLETNVKVTAEDDFKKLVQRKNKQTGQTAWVSVDERDLRELTNRRGAILVRNCILQILPKDLIEDAREECLKTVRKGVTDDPESARKRLIAAFGEIYVDPDMLEVFLGHPVNQCSPAEIQKLRGVYQSIRDGQSTWQEYANPAPKNGPDKGTINVSDLKPGTEENRGHGQDNLDQAAKPAEPATERVSACSDELYSQLVDTIQNAKEVGVAKKKIDDTIKNYTGPTRTREQLKDEEVQALIKSIADAAEKIGKP